MWPSAQDEKDEKGQKGQKGEKHEKDEKDEKDEKGQKGQKGEKHEKDEKDDKGNGPRKEIIREDRRATTPRRVICQARPLFSETHPPLDYRCRICVGKLRLTH